MSLFYEHHLIYQSSAPAALLDELAVVVDSEPFSESPGPVARAEFHVGEALPMVEEVPDIGSGWYTNLQPAPPRVEYVESASEPTVEEVPPIGSGWFDDAPPVVFPRPRFFASDSEPQVFADAVVAVGDDAFTESPGPVLRPGFYISPSAITEEDVPPIGSGWFTNPPAVVERQPFHQSLTELDLTDVPLIGSGWYTNPPDVVERPSFHLSTTAFELTQVAEIGSGWYTNLQPAPPRVLFHPSITEADLTDVPNIGSGWFDDAPSIVFERQPAPSVTDFAEDVVVVVLGDLVFTESPGPMLRLWAPDSRSDADLTDVPPIGSGWFTNPPPVILRPRYFESRAEPTVEEVPDIGSGWYMDAPPVVYRPGFYESPSAITEEDVPLIGSGWFTNPPPVILRPFVAHPGEPPGDLFEAVAAEDAFSEGPYLLLRRPFYDSVSEPMVEEVPDIGSGWYTNPPPVIYRPGYYPSTTELPFDDLLIGIDVKGPLSASLVHTGQSMAIEITSGILKVVEVPSTIRGLAFLVHQGNLVAEEITDGTLKADEC